MLPNAELGREEHARTIFGEPGKFRRAWKGILERLDRGEDDTFEEDEPIEQERYWQEEEVLAAARAGDPAAAVLIDAIIEMDRWPYDPTFTDAEADRYRGIAEEVWLRHLVELRVKASEGDREAAALVDVVSDLFVDPKRIPELDELRNDLWYGPPEPVD